MSDHGLWIFRESVEASNHAMKAFGYDPSNEIVNQELMDDQLMELRYQRGSLTITGDPVLPDGFPRPILSLPPFDFEPDFFTHGRMLFVSRRLRDALAQPSDVVQYWPVDLVRGSDDAYAQDYMLFRILASQDVMDRERSIYTRREITNRRTGETFTNVKWIRRFVPIGGFVPRTEIFRAAEAEMKILVTDALAVRVLKAGCYGVAFEEPETIGRLGIEPRRERTADGVFVHDPHLAEGIAERDARRAR